MCIKYNYYIYVICYMRKKFPVTLSLDNILVSKIDSQRGMIPRSAYVEKILIKTIGGSSEFEENS